MLPKIAFVVNGGLNSAMGERASSFASRLSKQFEITLLYRNSKTLPSNYRLFRSLVSLAPAGCYVFDMAAAGIAATGLYKHLTGCPFAVDTGDDIVALGRVLGRGSLSMLATRALEFYSLRAARKIIVRGSFHRELLAKRHFEAEFIPDGVDMNLFKYRPSISNEPKRPLVVGLVGSSVWIEKRQICYGWELVELLRLLKDKIDVRGMIIGDGSGIDILRKRAREYGVSERINFVGRLPFADLPNRLQDMDICLSTQTNDVIGNVRTTGKLPLYLAAARFVLASRVGEAARILPPEMLVDFEGEVDVEYPKKLAARIESLVANKTDFSHRSECVELARQNFDYDLLAPRIEKVIASLNLSLSKAVTKRSAAATT